LRTLNLKVFTDRATAEKNTRPWAGLVAALGGCGAIAILMRSLCFGIAGQALTARLRKLSFKHMLQQVHNFNNDYIKLNATASFLQ